MYILDRLVVGKHPDQQKCEDVIVVSPGLIAVVDGATDRTGRAIEFEGEPISSGRFAALVAARSLSSLPAGTAPLDAVAHLTSDFAASVRSHLGPTATEDLPSASVVVYDDVLRTVWRLGDCSFRIDDRIEMGTMPIDAIIAEFRAAYLSAMLLIDPSPSPGSDAARELIRPLIRIQGVFANRPGEFGYAVLNGMTVPESFVEIYPLHPSAREVVLASDGYPALPASLAEAEDYLADLLVNDPWCIESYRNTKGLREGNVSYDDRAWIRVRLD